MRSSRSTLRPRWRHFAGIGALTALMMLAAGCGGGDDPGADPPAAEPEEQTDVPEQDPDEDETTGPGQDPRVEAAVDDLADRQDADRDDIEVGALEAVTWSDGSIGCPEEGMSYTQALVDGYRLILSLNGQDFAYHSAGEDELSYCADPIDPADAPATS